MEALAAACTRVPEDPDPWSWLVENEISGRYDELSSRVEMRQILIRFFFDCQDFIIGDENAIVVAWRLLEILLLKYEEPNLTTLHKAVACKILSLDVVLPYWLELSYKVSCKFEKKYESGL